MENGYTMEIKVPLTVEEAKTVELPSWFHPIERVRLIGELAAQTSQLKIVGFSLGNQLAYTRKGLIEHAEIHERAEQHLTIIQQYRENNK